MERIVADLHLHSLYSDGSLMPEEIVNMAKEKGIETIALTEHDSIDSIVDFLSACDRYDIEPITGIEISTFFDGLNIHILGYGFDHSQGKNINEILKPYQEIFHKRSVAMLEMFRMHGVMDVSIDEIIEEISVNPSFLTVTHIGGHWRRLFPEIDVSMMKKDVWLGGRFWPDFDSTCMPSPFEAVELLSDIGAVAVVAHPGEFYPANSKRQRPEFSEIVDLIMKLKNKGLCGVEAFHPSHSKEVSKNLETLARNEGLLVTGGSDFHGVYKTNDIGESGIHREDLFALKDKIRR